METEAKDMGVATPAPDDTEPLLGEGGPKAFTFEEIAELIRKEHDRALYRDDPVMMTVTILNAFLGELQKLLARHDGTTREIMAEATSRHVQSVEKLTAGLAGSLSESSTKALRETFAAHAKAMNGLGGDLAKTRLNDLYCAGATVLAAVTFIVALFLGRF